jgi:hypothetical protein
MIRGTARVDFEAALQDPKAFFSEPQDVVTIRSSRERESLRYCSSGNRTPFTCQHPSQRVWWVARKTCLAEWSTHYRWCVEDTANYARTLEAPLCGLSPDELGSQGSRQD